MSYEKSLQDLPLFEGVSYLFVHVNNLQDNF